MKQPLLSEHDSAPRKNVLLTSCKNEKIRPSMRTMIVKILLLGVAVGLVLQAITVSAIVTIFKVWGREPQPQGLSNRAMYYILILLSQADSIAYCILTVVLFYFIARSGPMYRRKKFDHEDGTMTKEGESIWGSRRFVFRAGVAFMFSIMLGSVAPWVALHYTMGIPLPLQPMLGLLSLVLLLPVVYRCFDWAQQLDGEGEEDDETSIDEEQEEAGDAIV
jgi:NhaP-type Na+/H+ or K+/H+ antiporter